MGRVSGNIGERRPKKIDVTDTCQKILDRPIKLFLIKLPDQVAKFLDTFGVIDPHDLRLLAPGQECPVLGLDGGPDDSHPKRRNRDKTCADNPARREIAAGHHEGKEGYDEDSLKVREISAQTSCKLEHKGCREPPAGAACMIKMRNGEHEEARPVQGIQAVQDLRDSRSKACCVNPRRSKNPCRDIQEEPCSRRSCRRLNSCLQLEFAPDGASSHAHPNRESDKRNER